MCCKSACVGLIWFYGPFPGDDSSRAALINGTVPFRELYRSGIYGVDMGVLDFALIGVGLAMDAFAVAICKGLAMPKISPRQTLLIGLFFGGFQALMPFLGWFLGSRFAGYIDAVDHWIAFVLLLYIGGKMLLEAIKEAREAAARPDGMSAEAAEAAAEKFSISELFVMAIATSIDAFAVGITFAFFDANVGLACSIIGGVTVVISVGGVFIGHLFGARFGSWAKMAGGAVLIFIGARILVTGLGIL